MKVIPRLWLLADPIVVLWVPVCADLPGIVIIYVGQPVAAEAFWPIPRHQRAALLHNRDYAVLPARLPALTELGWHSGPVLIHRARAGL